MTELQRQFTEETGVSFDGIPINGVHLQYITWLEAQIQALLQSDVSSAERKFCPFCKNEVSRMHINCKNCDAHLMPD